MSGEKILQESVSKELKDIYSIAKKWINASKIFYITKYNTLEDSDYILFEIGLKEPINDFKSLKVSLCTNPKDVTKAADWTFGVSDKLDGDLEDFKVNLAELILAFDPNNKPCASYLNSNPSIHIKAHQKKGTEQLKRDANAKIVIDHLKEQISKLSKEKKMEIFKELDSGDMTAKDLFKILNLKISILDTRPKSLDIFAVIDDLLQEKNIGHYYLVRY